MPSPPGTDQQRRRLLSEAVHRFTTKLASSESDRTVPGLSWTVGELGAHLVVLPRLYRQMAERSEPMPLPPDLHEFSAERVAAVECRDVGELASLIRSEMADLLAFYGDDPTVGFNHWVTEQPLSVIESTLFNEFLIHGRDLDGVDGDVHPISRAEAVISLDGVLPVAANFVDPVAAGDLSATVHLRLRGGDGIEPVDWTQAINDGEMTVRKGRPARPDVHLNVDPVIFLLLSVGRVGPLKPTLTGKVLAYGRKPWLAARLSNIFHDV